MNSPQHLVREFHEAFGLSLDVEPDTELRRLRRNLIEEETQELAEALTLGDVMEIAKELADLVYVAYGTAVSLGIDLDLVIEQVHASNMSKLGADGKPVLREDGKVLKGPGYRPPDLSRLTFIGGAAT